MAYLIRHCIFIFLIILSWSSFTSAAEKQSTDIPIQENKIIKLTDRGIVPSSLTMKVEDSIIFLLNDTTDSLATLAIDFGEKKTHCASSNLTIVRNGVIQSARPFGPRDFATTCFHEKGTYPYTIYGLKQKPKGVTGNIIVE